MLRKIFSTRQFLDNRQTIRFLLLSFLLLGIFATYPHKAHAVSSQSIANQMHLSARRGAVEQYGTTTPLVLRSKNALQLSFYLHGTCLLGGDASALIFDQPVNQWHYVSLYEYANNCYDGTQTVRIPLRDFPGLNLTHRLGSFHVRFWNSQPYTIDIYETKVVLASNQQMTTKQSEQKIDTIIRVPRSSRPVATVFPGLLPSILPSPSPMASMSESSKPSAPASISPSPSTSTIILPLLLDGFEIIATPKPNMKASPSATPQTTVSPSTKPSPSAQSSSTITPTPTSTPASSPAQSATWSIQSVSSMKETKDAVCNPRSSTFAQQWVTKAKELGVNYVAVETPYDNPSCGNSVTYTKMWIDEIRAQGLHVWHRHMPLAFEGIYNVPKSNNSTYLSMIAHYVETNPTYFMEGDIFTPIPEPQNGGIAYITYCAQDVCQFNGREAFNTWLRNAIDASAAAFTKIGLENKVKIGYFGFDGFVAWGDNNPDWDGILDHQTVAKMGNITIDHYPEAVGGTMDEDLTELERHFPNVPIIIGEWGTINNENTEQQVKNTMAAVKKHPSVIGFNYWHLGMGGYESLIEDDFSNKAQFAEVRSFFKP